MKGYKVTNVNRSRIVGVACSTLKQLEEKGCKALNISDIAEIHLQDGTVVDSEDYFKTIRSQTLFVFRRKGEKILTGADIIYNELKCVNIDLLRVYTETKKFFDEETKDKIRVLSNLINKPIDDCASGDKKSLTETSHRYEHPEWFKDLDTNAKTKEAYMNKRCKSRIQGYFYNTRDSIRNCELYKSNVIAKRYLDRCFEEFWESLKLVNYFGWYFDRSVVNINQIATSLCDKIGNFKCGGLWNFQKCEFEFPNDHCINPYCSREERIIFGTWNLDHRIERSRTIIPAIVEASKACTEEENPKCRINSKYFWELLFTLKNLKLVHIVCHDKGQHKTAACDSEKYVIYVNEICKKKLKNPVYSDTTDFKISEKSNIVKRIKLEEFVST